MIGDQMFFFLDDWLLGWVVDSLIGWVFFFGLIWWLIGWLIAILLLFPFCQVSCKKKLQKKKATNPILVLPCIPFFPLFFFSFPLQVNNHLTHLPISLAQGKLHLHQKGSFVQIKTDFMLKVLYNWDGHLMVKIPSAYSGRVCGMCGNSNGDPHDDALLPDGTLAQNAVVLGQVWKVLDDHRVCLDSCSGECKRCSWKETAKYNTEAFCGLLTQYPGPFQGCHDAVHTDVYLKSCISDLCSYEGLHTVLCQALNTYVENCQEEGIVVEDWRTSARCFPSCPANSNHTLCGSACPTTCNDEAVPSDCTSSSCVEGCRCTEGFVLDAGKCIPKSECGCVFGDRLYGLGEEFWGDDGCTERCICEERRKAVCYRASCRAKEECGVKDGIRGCYPTSYGVCKAVGSTHYKSFDGEWFTFQGTCLYQLVGLCKKSGGLVDFQVLVQNGLKDGGSPSFITLVRVKVHGKSITISQKDPNKITVNDRSVNLPYSHNRKILIYKGGRDVVIETDFGLTINYDWHGDVGVSVPSTYEDTLCGLCGNFNGDRRDEMMLKNGRLTSNLNTFGQSWKVADTPGCTELSRKECLNSMTTVGQENRCEIISRTDGPFRGCHATVDPSKYVQNCKNDLCLYPEREEVLCQHIAHYVDLCQEAGVTIEEWRTNDFCRIFCPAHSHYELCSLDCSRTCSSIFAPLRCTERCREGCVCDEGFVFSGDECVPMARCGCLHHGFYYKVEEIFRPDELEECECQAGGVVVCKEIPPEKNQCQDGQLQCSTTSCVVTGDRSYLSFDGTAFDIPGACSYILTESCTDDDNAEHFVVKIKKDSRQKRKVSGIEEVTVEVYGLTLTLERGKVNSISHRLPAILNQGQVQVHPHGVGIHLQTDFGLIVRYDLYHYITVTAPQGYQGHLCGLCGNNNGKSEDDFLFPDGHPAPNVTSFGSAWKIPNVACQEKCSEDDCPVCTEEKKKIFQKPNYCGILTDPNGPFSSCFSILNPALYLDACTRDLCLTKGKTNVLCRSIQSYASSCQAAGVNIEAWRKPSFCPSRCPANSTYSLCSNLCTNTCAGLLGASECPQTCAEGCSCNEGFVFDGEGCIPKEKCGCFEDGIYYKPHELVLKENCQQRCTCIPGKGLDCTSHQCTDDETCEIQDGILRCINQNPCKALGCRPRETCKTEDGQAKCVPSLVASCWAWGDPHYRTFDRLDFDFEGTCTYTMAEFCGNDSKLVPFKVQGKNRVRGEVKSISYISLANIEVYGHRISIHWREVGKVRVDGVLTLLPVTLQDDRVLIFQSGMTAVLQTDFGLRVTYDWNWHLIVDLPSSYSEQTCGLCGNFNLEPGDDIPMQAGNLTSSIISWASTWKVPDEDPFCWDFCNGECPVCEEEKQELYSGNQHCGLIKKSFQGPFKACHDVVNPRDFFRNCLYDVCMSDGAKKILCKTLETYASTCRKHGAVVHDWRTPSGCSLPCPEHSHYEPCGTACPATCTDPDAPKSCTQPCVESCACDPGYVLSGAQCVPTSSCGCTHDGLYHPPGEEFWADELCHSRCRCDAALGMVVCKEGSCKAGEQCRVEKGVRQCVATERFVCVATGDPHYTTFDGRRYDFMGTCVYQFAALCSPDPTLVPFVVTVQNNHRGSQVVSYTKEVTLKVYNVTLSLSQAEPKKLKVNGILVDLPFRHSPQLYAYASGVHAFLVTDFGLVVTFDWHSYARVILPSTYARSVCGLCGNADGDPADDLSLPDGQLATDENTFGNSWKVADVPGCDAACSGDCSVCSEAEKRVYRGDKHCGLLVKQKGPFANCHGVIDPAPYFEDCLFDACLYKGHQEVVCSAVSAYVTACQSQRFWIAKPFWDAKQCVQPQFCMQNHPGVQSRAHKPRFGVQSHFRVESKARRPHFLLQSCTCSPHSACKSILGCKAEHASPVLGCRVISGWKAKHADPISCISAASAAPILHAKPSWGRKQRTHPPFLALQPQSWGVEVDGERHLLPVSIGSNAVTVTQEGIHRVLRARGGLKLLYDGATYVLVSLPSTYQGHTGGLCGDFDGDVANDVTEPQKLGEKWGIPTQGCNHGSPWSPCPRVEKSGCDVLEDAKGPFGGCHKVVTPRDYVESCVMEMCGKEGSTTLCRSLQAYAAACQAAGGQLQEWREAAKCPLTCPVGTEPQLCSPLCSQSCTSLSSTPQCSSHCFEGCACPAGELFNGDECVTPDACGCLHRGRFFQIAETILSSDCSEICTCRAAGGMQCKPAGCPFGQVCTMEDGVRMCKEQPGRCTLIPSSRLVSFDGNQGATTAVGIYVVASLCNPDHPHWFRLLGDVEEDEDRPLVVALHLFSRAAFVTVRRDKKVWVGGLPCFGLRWS
uniref:VWFD domain-containing protein n=1 Tax=Chrysolophus pictus TaxID=9089 RepID=A0A8C3KY79_CHRPC